MDFAVIEFSEDNDVAVVRTNWIFSQSNQQVTWWPVKRYKQAVLENHVPDEQTWRVHVVKRIFKKTGMKAC